MPARSVCLVTLPLSEAGPGHFGGQVSVVDIYHTIPYHTIPYVPGGGEQLPGWVAVCTATSCSCSRGRPPYLFANNDS